MNRSVQESLKLSYLFNEMKYDACDIFSQIQFDTDSVIFLLRTEEVYLAWIYFKF